MDKFLEFVVDYVFSAGTAGLLCLGFLVYCLIQIAETTEESRVNAQDITEQCYNQNLVVVETDAGTRCVEPRSLVKPKGVE